jgi:phosphate:Na+ symporter
VGTYDGDRKSIDRHLYKKAQVQSESYQDKYIVYTTKYLNRIKK